MARYVVTLQDLRFRQLGPIRDKEYTVAIVPTISDGNGTAGTTPKPEALAIAHCRSHYVAPIPTEGIQLAAIVDPKDFIHLAVTFIVSNKDVRDVGKALGRFFGVADEAAKLVPVVGDLAKYPIAAGKLLGGLLEKVEDSTSATESRKFLASEEFGVGRRHVHESSAEDGALFTYVIVREP